MSSRDEHSPEEIERDLERTRAEIGYTIDTLQERLTPGQLADQAWAYLRRAASQPGAGESRLARAVRENPLPVILISAGLAWLGMAVATQRNGAPGDRRFEVEGRRLHRQRTAQTWRSTMTKNGPGPEVMGASTLIGDKVSNRQGEQLGKIEEIMLDTQFGRVAYAVLSFGGVLGLGDKLFAIPWRALRLDTANKQFILDLPKERLEQAPGFDKNAWPRMASPEWAGQVHEYYGAEPYWY